MGADALPLKLGRKHWMRHFKATWSAIPVSHPNDEKANGRKVAGEVQIDQDARAVDPDSVDNN